MRCWNASKRITKQYNEALKERQTNLQSFSLFSLDKTQFSRCQKCSVHLDSRARSSVESELVQEIQSFRIASFWWLLKFGEAHFGKLILGFQKAGSLCHSSWSILWVAHILCWLEITWSLSQTHKRHIQLCFFVLFLQVLIYIYRYLFSCSL